MPGRVNNIIYAGNCDFSGDVAPEEANGLYTNGQLWIGTTEVNAGGTHINVGTITSPDSSITIGYDSPNITLQANSGLFTWFDISGTFTAVKNRGYFITGTATANLPASPSQGDTIKFFVDSATQFLTIDAPGTQIIRLGSSVTSAGGTIVSTQQGDSLELVYRASNNCWEAVCGSIGNWT